MSLTRDAINRIKQDRELTPIEQLIGLCSEMSSNIPYEALVELSSLKARAEKAETTLEHLFQACEDLPLPEMNRMEKEINEASNALKQGEKE